jgi:hypothetical protein
VSGAGAKDRPVSAREHTLAQTITEEL